MTLLILLSALAAYCFFTAGMLLGGVLRIVKLRRHLVDTGIYDALEHLQTTGESNMATINEALKLIKGMADTDEKNAAALQTVAASLGKVSDNIDALVAKIGAATVDVPAEVMLALQTEADKVDAVRAGIEQLAATSAALAAKGVETPVPVPAPV